MAGRNFSLTGSLSDFVDRQVDEGRHQNASEVVREALRRYQDDVEAEEASLAAIKAVAARGMAAIERGEYRSVVGEDGHRALFNDFMQRADERAQKRKG